MIAHVLYRDAHFYIADVEVKEDDKNDRYSMLLLHDTKLLEVSDGHLRAVLHFTAENHGRWTREWQLKNLVKERFKHDCNNAMRYANRFFNYMQAVVGEVTSISSKSLLLIVDESKLLSGSEMMEYNLPQLNIRRG
jgi:hypothetical protein